MRVREHGVAMRMQRSNMEEEMKTAVIESQVGVATTRARPFYTRLAALGFVLIALAGLISLGFALAAGSTRG